MTPNSSLWCFGNARHFRNTTGDEFFRPTAENVERLREALVEFGFTEHDLPPEVFLAKGSVLTFGFEPARVDLRNEIDGITYDEARPGAVRGAYGRVEELGPRQERHG